MRGRGKEKVVERMDKEKVELEGMEKRPGG
jgi:hypothetical protein